MTPVFIFDIGNVLIDFDLERLQQRVAKASGKSLPCIRRNWRGKKLKAVETGTLSGSKYFQDFCGRTGLRWTYQEWVNAWMDIYSRNALGQGLFAGMKARNYPVCVLSNLAEYNKIAIERKFKGFFEQASRNFLSYEMGLQKPDLRIYSTICESLGVDPDQCFVLDDAPDNVGAAKKVGMRGYVFSPQSFQVIVAEIEDVLKTCPR